MKNRTTKRAMLFSVIALVLCMSMFVGTTYAWFTDSVTSANNVIVSGNLDIEMYYDNDETADWTKVDADTNVFKQGTLWEPGHVEVVKFRINNEGTLALKYQLAVNVAKETSSVNVNGANFKLSDYIKFAVIDGDQNFDRATAVAEAEKTATALSTAYGTDYIALEAGASTIVTMVVYMPESVGNEANYAKGANIPQINLGVNLIATQLDFEPDSFGPDYDEGAVYYDVLATTAEELYTVVENAKANTVIAVDGNIVLTKALSKSGLESIKFVAWDNEATIDQAKYNMHFAGAKVTFEGLNLTHGEKAYGNGGQTSTAFAVWDASSVSYVDCTFARSVGTIHAATHNFIGCTFNGVENPDNSKSEYPLYICSGEEYNVVDCTFNCTNRGAILFYNDGGDGVDTLNISGTKFLGDVIDDKTAVEIHNNSKTQIYNVNIKDVEVGDGIKNGLYRIKPGNVGTVNVKVDGVTDVVTVSKSDDLTSAINNAEEGDTIYLDADVNMGGTQLAFEKPVTIDLNGKTLDLANNYGGMTMKNGASIVNGVINQIGNTAAIKVFQADTIENVVINVTETAGKTKGGIVIQSGDCYVKTIKNVTINGTTNGIECYRSTSEYAIGSMENVTINATENGIYINGAGRIGKITNCSITGGLRGINAYVANLWHVSLDIENSTVSGSISGIDMWDEGAANTGSTVTLKYDDATVFLGERENIKITLQEEITCTVNGVVQTTPCDIRK